MRLRGWGGGGYIVENLPQGKDFYRLRRKKKRKKGKEFGKASSSQKE